MRTVEVVGWIGMALIWASIALGALIIQKGRKTY